MTNTKSRFTAAILTVIIAMNLVGCGGVSLPDLPDDAIAFEMGKFVDADDDDEAYGTIEYEGRTYIGYGTLAKSLTGKDIDECVGYIIMDENSSSVTDLNDRSVRVYTLADDTEHNYLLECDTDTSLMSQPSFWRAIDTKGQNISTPDCIESLEYVYWNR